MKERFVIGCESFFCFICKKGGAENQNAGVGRIGYLTKRSVYTEGVQQRVDMRRAAWYIRGVNNPIDELGGEAVMKKAVSSVLLCVLLCACGKASVVVKEGVVVEYGAELKVENLTDEKVTLKEVKGYDAKKTGEQKVTAIFVNEKDKEIEAEITLEVKDTKKPVIKLKKEKVEITAGDKFDATSNIESVKDPVDGDLKKSKDTKLTKNGYLITSDVNAKKAGSYTVKVTAYDVNGNKAESSYKVTVKKKPQEQTPTQNNNQTSSNNSYSNNQGNTNYSKPTSGSTSSTKKPSSASSNNGGSSSGQTTNKPHKHWGPAVEGMYFDSGDELDAWAIQYHRDQMRQGNDIGAAWGVSECSCGKLFIHRFY